MAHQFVAGKGAYPVLAGSESVGTQSVGLVEKIGYDCFDDFDYVALGHIHSPQGVGRDEIRYAGSPLKYSLSEAHNEKSVPLITVSAEERVKIELVPLKPLRNLRHIRGTLKELLDEKNVKARDDFIYATLTDEDIISDAMGIFQQVYPRTVRIDYDNSHTVLPILNEPPDNTKKRGTAFRTLSMWITVPAARIIYTKPQKEPRRTYVS